MSRCRVEPVRLYRPEDPINSLTDASDNVCAAIIRQISSLALISLQLFDDLTDEARRVAARAEALGGRVARLRETATKLNAVTEEGEWASICGFSFEFDY